jgi:hypothetical protein
MRGEERFHPQAKCGIAFASLFEEKRSGAAAELSGGLKQGSLIMRVRLHSQTFAIRLPEQAHFSGEKYVLSQSGLPTFNFQPHPGMVPPISTRSQARA